MEKVECVDGGSFAQIIPKDAPVGEPQNRLDKLELQKLLERKHEREEADDDGSRIAGLGFGDSKYVTRRCFCGPLLICKFTLGITMR
jgi:hypothetical protein